jgi:hypothetical protein
MSDGAATVISIAVNHLFELIALPSWNNLDF